MIYQRTDKIEKDAIFNTPYVVVLGVYRSGSSLLAGVLHELGVNMGSDFHAADDEACPTGTFEQKPIWQFCQHVFDEPFTHKKFTPAERVAALSHLIRLHRRGVSGMAGAKHPLLCALIPEILMATPDVKFISIERDLERSVASLSSLKWWGADESQYRDLLMFLQTQKEMDLAGEDHLSLTYDQLLAKPVEVIDDIVSYLNLEVTAQQTDAAQGLVNADFKRF